MSGQGKRGPGKGKAGATSRKGASKSPKTVAPMQFRLDKAACRNQDEQLWMAFAFFAFLLAETEPDPKGKVTKQALLAHEGIENVLPPKELAALRGGKTHSTREKRERGDISDIGNLVAVVYDVFIECAWKWGFKIEERAVYLWRGKKLAGFHGMQLRRPGQPSL